MGVQIPSCTSADDVRQAVSPIGHYFGRSLPNDELAERLIRFLPAERVYAAWQDGRAVGGLGAFPFRLTIRAAGWPRPGSQSPASCRRIGGGGFFAG
jgi:hypothetical protein